MIDTMELCATCNNDSKRYAYLGKDEYECEDCYEVCTEPAPESIEFYNTRITGTGVASCKNCSFTCVYWECACELSHDCESENEQ